MGIMVHGKNLSTVSLHPVLLHVIFGVCENFLLMVYYQQITCNYSMFPISRVV